MGQVGAMSTYNWGELTHLNDSWDEPTSSYWSYVHQLSYRKSAIYPIKPTFSSGFPNSSITFWVTHAHASIPAKSPRSWIRLSTVLLQPARFYHRGLWTKQPKTVEVYGKFIETWNIDLLSLKMWNVYPWSLKIRSKCGWPKNGYPKLPKSWMTI